MPRSVGLIFWVLCLSGYGLADSGYFICENVEGIAEWTIYVDLNEEQAGFFDNNMTSMVPLIAQHLTDSTQPQHLYIFEGFDLNGRSKDLLRIHFNKTKLTATVMVGAKGEIIWEAKGGCRAVSCPEVSLGQ